MNSNNVPIIGQNKITVSMVPSAIYGTFDVQIDTACFSYGVPIAVQCLLQAAMALIPAAYQTIAANPIKGDDTGLTGAH